MSTAFATGTILAATALGQVTAQLLTDSCQQIERTAGEALDNAASCPPDVSPPPMAPPPPPPPPTP